MDMLAHMNIYVNVYDTHISEIFLYLYKKRLYIYIYIFLQQKCPLVGSKQIPHNAVIRWNTMQSDFFLLVFPIYHPGDALGDFLFIIKRPNNVFC